MAFTDILSSLGELLVGAVVAGAAVSTRLAARRAELATNALATQQKTSADAAAVQADFLATQQKAAAAAAAQPVKVAADLLAVNTNERIIWIAKTNEKLDVLHTLANSSMTIAIQAELDAKRALMVFMQKEVDPSPEAQAEMAITKAKIAELSAIMLERNKASEGLPLAHPLPASEPQPIPASYDLPFISSPDDLPKHIVEKPQLPLPHVEEPTPRSSAG